MLTWCTNKNVGVFFDEIPSVGVRYSLPSMTKEERHNPSILNASRRRRIASGCAMDVMEINSLVKNFELLKRIMSKQLSGKKVNPMVFFR